MVSVTVGSSSQETFSAASTQLLLVSFQQSVLLLSRTLSKTCGKHLVNTRRQEADRAAFTLRTPPSSSSPSSTQNRSLLFTSAGGEHLTGIYEVMGNEAAAATVKIHKSVVYVLFRWKHYTEDVTTAVLPAAMKYETALCALRNYLP